MKRPSTREIVGFNDFWLILIGLLLAGLLLPILLTGGRLPFLSIPYWIVAAISTIITGAYWAFGRFIAIQLRRKLPELSQSFRRIALQSLIMVAFIFIAGLIGFSFLRELPRETFGKEYANAQIQPSITSCLLVSLLMSIAILSIYESIYMLQQWKKAAIESEQIRKEAVLTQLHSLKERVNPHFLFNSLNTLSALVHDQPDLAVTFIQNLSNTYRSILEIRDQELISLKEELKYAQSYISLLKTRFGSSMEVNVNIDEAASSLYLIPLSLQIVIENAIKHNIASQRRPLRIDIIALPGGILQVRNNRQIKLNPEASTGMGLENIRSRYALVSKRKLEVKEDDSSFIVNLPLIEVIEDENSNR